MTEEERNIFKKTLSEASPVPLEAGTLEKMAGFCDLLFEKNKVMNLTAVKTPQAAAILHFADSLYALTAEFHKRSRGGVRRYEHRYALRQSRGAFAQV